MSDGRYEVDEGVSDLVWDAVGVCITGTRGNFELCWVKRVGDIDDPTSIAWTDGLFQVSFLYCLLYTAWLLKLAGLAASFWVFDGDCALKAISVTSSCRV